MLDSSRYGWLRILFLALGAGFLVFAIVSQWNDIGDELTLSVPRAGIAIVLSLVSTAALAQAWRVLLPSHADGARMRRVFYLAQPAKYIPGGFAQPLGQVALTANEGVPVATAATAFVVHAACGASAGALVGSGLVFVSEAPTWVRIVAAAGVLTPLLLWRPIFVRLVGLVGSIARRDTDESVVPAQAAILGAFALAVAGVVLTAAAFAIIGRGGDALGGAPHLVAGYAFAWTVGYVAVPFPSGLGIREAALALALPGSVGTAAAVSAIHRLVTMTAELALFLFGRR